MIDPKAINYILIAIALLIIGAWLAQYNRMIEDQNDLVDEFSIITNRLFIIEGKIDKLNQNRRN